MPIINCLIFFMDMDSFLNRVNIKSQVFNRFDIFKLKKSRKHVAPSIASTLGDTSFNVLLRKSRKFV